MARKGRAGAVEREVALDAGHEAGGKAIVVAERDAAAGAVEARRAVVQRGQAAEGGFANAEIDERALGEDAETQKSRAFIVLCLRDAGAHSGHEKQESCRDPGKVAIYIVRPPAPRIRA